MSTATVATSKNCLQAIFARLEACRFLAILEERQENGALAATGGDLLSLVNTAREHIRNAGVKPGDRCALLAENGIRWVAANLAIFAEGLICVPLYPRQAPEELAAMLADCEPALLLSSTATLRDALGAACGELPLSMLFDEVFPAAAVAPERIDPPVFRAPSDPMTIIYTSGTSGVSKGVLLTVGNVSHMLAIC